MNSHYKRCSFYSRSAEIDRLGKSALRQPCLGGSRPQHSCLCSTCLPTSLLCRTLRRPPFSAFSTINAAVCRCRHRSVLTILTWVTASPPLHQPTQRFNISHLNIFGGRMHSGENWGHQGNRKYLQPYITSVPRMCTVNQSFFTVTLKVVM